MIEYGLYYPSEIVKKTNGFVSVRQITDLAEKGVVTPVRDTNGGGTPRLYDDAGVLKIFIAVSLRGILNAKELIGLFNKKEMNGTICIKINSYVAIDLNIDAIIKDLSLQEAPRPNQRHSF